MSPFLKTLPLLCLAFFAEAQDSRYPPCYYYEISLGEYFANKGDLAEAIKHYEKAFDISPPCTYKILEVATAFAKTGDKRKARELVAIALDKGMAVETVIAKDELRGLRKEKYWEARKKHPVTHPDWQRRIEDLYGIDQFVRKKIFYKSNRDDCTRRILVETDSVIITELLDSLEVNGYPSLNMVGEQAHQHLYIMVLHGGTGPDWAFERLEPILEDAMRKGNLSPSTYAGLVDRRRQLDKDLPQLYGKCNLRNSKPRSYAPILDVENVDKRRRELGLLPIHIEVETLKWREYYPDGYTFDPADLERNGCD